MNRTCSTHYRYDKYV